VTLLAGALSFGLVHPAHAQLTFNFDNANPPPLNLGQNVPFDQTVGGVTAHFSSPQFDLVRGFAFFVQNVIDMAWNLPLFSDNVLGGKNLSLTTGQNDSLDISFRQGQTTVSQPMTTIALDFATVESTAGAEFVTTLLLTAFDGSTQVGSATALSSFVNGQPFPTGHLTFTSAQPFDSVHLVTEMPGLAKTFIVDNIVVTPVPEPGGCALAAAVALGVFSLGRLEFRRRKAA
jgi:hypothetical protein